MNISLLLISTNKYKQFVQPLLNGVIKNFLPDHQIMVHLFTDELQDLAGTDRVQVSQYIIPPYKFPEATLMRYRIFTNHAHFIKGDFVVYLDVDMSVVDVVGDEFLSGDITGVCHPGFWYNAGWGSEGVDPNSLAYIAPELRKRYYCGGVQAGKRDCYMEMSRRLADNIDNDTSRGILAQWHDESHFNAFVSWFMSLDYPEWKLNELTPSYCMPPSLEQRRAWWLDTMPAKILCLDKNHAEVRS